MSNQECFDASRWSALVADKYNLTVLNVTHRLKESLNKHDDLEVAKLAVVQELERR